MLEYSETQELVVEESGDRLDRFLSNHTPLSRSRAVNLILDQKVLVNGSIKDKNYKLSSGDIVEFELPEDEEIEAIPENIQLDIVYEDSDIILINKEPSNNAAIKAK